MAVTLRDVSRLAGVSMGTASQAINNSSKVSAETRSRVLDAARSLGYEIKENNFQSPIGKPISVIGMLAKHDVGEPVSVNPFYSHIQAGVEAECRRRGINLMFSSIEVGEMNHPVRWPVMLEEQRIEGLILVGTFIEDTLDYIDRRIRELPTVLIDSYAPRLPYDSVVTNNLMGARLAIEHLIDLGHTCIGVVGSSPASTPSILERREGAIQTLRAHHLEATQYIENSDLARQFGREATMRLLARASEVTAIFACNDDTSTGVYQAARELGLKIPDDLSVIGFDNIDLSAELTPPMTTIHVHKTWMGNFGVQLLLDRAQNFDKPQVSLLVSTQLIVRASTAPNRISI